MSKPREPLRAHIQPTALGDAIVAVDARGAVTHLGFLDGRGPGAYTGGLPFVWDADACRDVSRQLHEFLAGERQQFELATAASGTPFQHTVWAEVARIPYGWTASYGEVAARLGKPGASRAVGRANATNPLSLIVPCHRVIGSTGTLTGYGGGLPAKEALLALERRVAPAAARSSRAGVAQAALFP